MGMNPAAASCDPPHVTHAVPDPAGVCGQSQIPPGHLEQMMTRLKYGVFTGFLETMKSIMQTQKWRFYKYLPWGKITSFFKMTTSRRIQITIVSKTSKEPGPSRKRAETGSDHHSGTKVVQKSRIFCCYCTTQHWLKIKWGRIWRKQEADRQLYPGLVWNTQLQNTGQFWAGKIVETWLILERTTKLTAGLRNWNDE